METNFRFLLGNEFSFPWKRVFVSSQEMNFCFQETKIRFRGTVPLGPVPLQDFSSTSRPLVVIVAGAARFESPWDHLSSRMACAKVTVTRAAWKWDIVSD